MPLRPTARVVPVDADGRVLLLRGEPQDGREHWFTIGGQIENGESPAQAAARELREETGIDLDPAALGPPVYVGPHTFTYAGLVLHTHAHVYAVSLDPATPLSFADIETGEIIEAAEWRRPDDFPLDGASEPPLVEFLRAAVSSLGPAD